MKLEEESTLNSQTGKDIEMRTIIFFAGFLLPCFILTASAQESLPMLRDVSIEVTISRNLQTSLFKYQYLVRNSSNSTGKIRSFDIDITRPQNTVKFSSDGLTIQRGRKQIPFVEDIVTGTTVQMVPVGAQVPAAWTSGLGVQGVINFGVIDAPGFILPGDNQGGFELLSPGPPGIRRVQISPKFVFRSAGEETTEEDVQRASIISQQINVTTQTIGPIAPISLEPDSLADDLISLKEGLLASGGIFGPGAQGIEKSLDAKLDAAKKSIAKGKNKTAKNQLNAFINELEAQRGKHLTDNAFFLLKVNAEFIISKLGT